MATLRNGRWWAAAAVVLLAGSFLFFTRDGSGEPVRVALVRQETLVSSLTTNGKVEPGEAQEVRAAGPAFVRRVLVKEGDNVRKGQLLAELDRGQAAAEAARARAELEAAEADAQAVTRGGSAAELNENERRLRDARATRDEARRTLEVNERLLARNAIARAEVESARDRLRQAEREIAFLEQRSKRTFSAADRDRAKARIASARASLAYAGQQLGASRIVASMSGTVYSLPVRQGNFVNTGDLIARVGKLDRARVVVYVDEPELGRVEAGQEVRVTWAALPSQEWTGAVERVPSEVTALGTRSVGEVMCTVSNPGRKLLPNVNVDVEILLQRRASALTLPKEAILHAGNDSSDRAAQTHHVFVVDDGTLRRRAVKVGASSATRTEIASGLSLGNKVALPGERPLEEGRKVKILP